MTFDAVLIGRNEGARLAAAIGALAGQARRIVYVDSGSSDDSVTVARNAGASVVQLDPSRPFTAARGRNEGFDALGPERAPYTLFMDGDAITLPDWPATALAFLEDHPKAALVHGQTLEEAPEASIYNWLTDQEWRSPAGPQASGVGRFVVRADVFEQSGGFRNDMIAAEDDELFLRIRAMGWDTWAIDAPMCHHDVKLTQFGPWFRRMVRAGHSFEELAHLHPGTARAQRLRALFWAGVLPVAGIMLTLVSPLLILVVEAIYTLSILRLSLRFHRMGLPPDRALHGGFLLMVSKFANLYGMIKFWIRRLRRSDAQIIEYK